MISNWSTDTYFFHLVDNKHAMVKNSLHKQNGTDTVDSPWILGHFPGNIYDSSVKIMIDVYIYVGKSLLSSTGPSRCSQFTDRASKLNWWTCAILGWTQAANNGIKGKGEGGASPWRCHQMETFSVLLAICAGNSLVTGEFPTQRPVTRTFDVFFDPPVNKQLSKQ